MDKNKEPNMTLIDLTDDFEVESQMGKLSKKAKESPFMIAGLLGCVGVVAYSLYGIKQRKLPLSLYLIQTRVGAQGFVVTCLTVGLGLNMFKDYVYPKVKELLPKDNEK